MESVFYILCIFANILFLPRPSLLYHFRLIVNVIYQALQYKFQEQHLQQMRLQKKLTSSASEQMT